MLSSCTVTTGWLHECANMLLSCWPRASADYAIAFLAAVPARGARKREEVGGRDAHACGQQHCAGFAANPAAEHVGCMLIKLQSV